MRIDTYTKFIYRGSGVVRNRKYITTDKMNKTIITVVGKDAIGIIAKVCSYLAENNLNILDISQTIVQEYFNMMMIEIGRAHV